MASQDLGNSIQGRLNQANGRLKAGNVPIRIEQLGGRLCLRGTLPPKPGSDKSKPFQQRITLAVRANPAGLKLAEAEAKKVGVVLDSKTFSWEPYTLAPSVSQGMVGEWIARFEADYWQRRDRNPKSETTWEFNYSRVFARLPADEPLSAELLLQAVAATKPDTRTRQGVTVALISLARFAGLAVDLKPLRGCYSPSRVNPRDLPTDELIAECRGRIPSETWRYAYSLIAIYGLRPHEVFHLNLSRFPIVEVGADTKTGARIVYPFYPEWAEDWLTAGSLPAVTGRRNSDLGKRVGRAFRRYGIPFKPYDLRHAWAIRSMLFGLDPTLSARQMGHSVQIHAKVYHAWINENTQQKAYEALMSRADRPLPPSLVR